MPSLTQHKSQRFVKLLLLGDAKSGKTGSLVSLVKAGYKLRILDFDNLLDILAKLVSEQCPDKADNVEYRTLRDKRVASPSGPIIDGNPQAYVNAVKMLDRWKYKQPDGTEIDLGVPATWGPECVLVIDSLSRMCDAAYDFREPLTPKGAKSGEADARATYGDAQDAIENNLANLTSDGFETNVIVICHGLYMDLPDGKKIFPQGIGQKLSPKIPQYFPNYVRLKNMAERRTIQLQSDALIDLAVSNPTELPKTLPAETGLATLFEHLRGPLELKLEIKDGRPSQPRPSDPAPANAGGVQGTESIQSRFKPIGRRA